MFFFVGLIPSHLPTLAIIVGVAQPPKGGLGYGATINQYKWEWPSPSILSRWYNSIQKTLLGGVCKKKSTFQFSGCVFSKTSTLILQDCFWVKKMNEANCPFFTKFHFHCPGHQKFVVPTGIFQIHIPLLGGSFKKFLFSPRKLGKMNPF